jgi:L-2-hydroxyglutarate oxidase LhgO
MSDARRVPEGLQPHLRLEIIERRPGEAQESSGAWNNAGTGHAANCELNYTPMRKDSVDIEALEVNVEFDMSPVLVVPHPEGRHRLAGLVHPSGAAWAS